MPNWCNNTVTIYGPIKKIKQLHEAAQKGELLETMAPIGEWDYDNAVNAWGTKWDISEDNGLEYEEIEKDRASLSGWFDTAWGPPLEAYSTFLNNNEDCDLGGYYYEPGMGFCGAWSNGSDEQYDISGDSHWVEENIPESIIEEFDIVESMRSYEDEEELTTWIKDGAQKRNLSLETQS